MPTYSVTDPSQTASWNITEPAPGQEGNRPKVTLTAPANTYVVQQGQWQNFALSSAGTEALITELPDAEAAAFLIFYQPYYKSSLSIGSMISLPKGPDAGNVPWFEMVSGMGAFGTQYGLLVTTKSAGDEASFAMAAGENSNIHADNFWVYNADASGFSFIIDAKGNVGQAV